MKFKDDEAKENWNKFVSVNQDMYGSGVVRFAQKWANMMEALSPDKFDPEVAKKSEDDADTEGITGFMFGCAVNALSKVWIYGDDLRKWHNKQYGVSEDTTGVVNPAVFTIETK